VVALISGTICGKDVRKEPKVAEYKTTSFRFDEGFAGFLENRAKAHGLSKTDVIIQSCIIVGALFEEARRNAMADLAALLERYGDEAELICSVSMGSDGLPVGHVVIDLEPVGDVVARPFADREAGVSHVFLEVDRERGEAPNLIPLGGEWLFLPESPRLPLGSLPWPPRPDMGIKIRLGDLAKLLTEDPPKPAELVKV
jgi:hypothetical protein